MKKLIKHIDCGKYSFGVGINREIAVETFEAFPQLTEYIFERAEKGEQENIDSPTFIKQLLEKKELSKLIQISDQIGECVKFAFPKMLKLAEETLDVNELIEYIVENGVEQEFNQGVFEIILQGFTQREVVPEKKVNFSIK
jgi:hypothetical protein